MLLFCGLAGPIVEGYIANLRTTDSQNCDYQIEAWQDENASSNIEFCKWVKKSSSYQASSQLMTKCVQESRMAEGSGREDIKTKRNQGKEKWGKLHREKKNEEHTKTMKS